MKASIKRSLMVAGILLSACVYAAPVEIAQGNMKLVMYPETGGFSLYQLSGIGKNRYEPLFDERNSSATSFFSVQSNGRVFRLAKKTGKPVAFDQADASARYTFTLTDDFQVVQSFSFVNGSGGSPIALLIETAIENTSGKPGTFALKAVIDTCLGETGGMHFRTDVRNRVSSESRFEIGIDPDRYIVSSNKDLSLLLLLAGKSVSEPSAVYAANWDRLNTLSWKPDYSGGRSFNTVYSINDSALLYIWPEKTLEPNESLRVSMILGPETPELVALSGKKSPVPTVSTETASGKSSQTGTGLTKEERDGLVMHILERIDEIQMNPGSASNEELAQLNAALDLLLQKARNDDR